MASAAPAGVRRAGVSHGSHKASVTAGSAGSWPWPSPWPCGCQTVKTPEEKIAKSNMPREFTKVSMPDYVVEPPDLHHRRGPRGPPGPADHRRAAGPARRQDLARLLRRGLRRRPDDRPRSRRRSSSTSASTSPTRSLGLIRGTTQKTSEYEDVEPAESNRVFVDVTAYNSKVYYVQGDVGRARPAADHGQRDGPRRHQLRRRPDPDRRHRRTSGWSARPRRAPAASRSCRSTSPRSSTRGDPTTNYQLMPGDRLVVYRDPIVRTTIFIDRLAAPFQTVLNSMLQYSFTARSVKSISVPINGGASRWLRRRPAGRPSWVPGRDDLTGRRGPRSMTS